MSLFGKKPTQKEQQRAADRQMRKVGRDLERDRALLERQEKTLVSEIKKSAREGNKEACAILAKQLVNLRKQKVRSLQASSNITSISAQAKAMSSNLVLTDAMAATAKTMGAVNKVMDPMKVAQTMKDFEASSMRMGMTEEMMNDAFDEIADGSDDEQLSDNVISKVLDEIGIEISGAMVNAPSAGKGKLGEKQATSDEELVAKLAQLRTPE